MTTETASICEANGSASLERTRFFARQLIGPDDLTQDQVYFREKLRRHNRLLHGWGVVCGARVRQGTEDCQVVVEAGYILSLQGDEIVIESEMTVDLCTEDLEGNAVSACGESADPWCAQVRVERSENAPLYLAVRYAECTTRPVRVATATCGCNLSECEYSRTRESYAIKVLTELPASYRDPKIFPQVPPSEEELFRCVAGDCAGRECPLCPTDPWVILADITLRDEGAQISIDCFTHRRYVASFSTFYIQCRQPGTTAGGVPAGVKAQALLKPNTLVDMSAGAEETPSRTVPILRANGSWMSLPVSFPVRSGDTFATLLQREGERQFYDAVTDKTVKLRDLYALAGVNPSDAITSVDKAMAPLEGIKARVDDLEVVRDGLRNLLNTNDLDRLTTELGGHPSAATGLPITALQGVSPRTALGAAAGSMPIGQVAGMTQEEFVTQVTANVEPERKALVESQARTAWESAVRVNRLSTSFETK